jgi:hypothetical protein
MTLHDRTDGDSPRARLVWGLARGLSGLAGLLLLFFGAIGLWGFYSGLGWWMLAVGSLFLAGGVWFLWASLLGSRALIDRIASEFVINLIEKLF